MELRAPTCQYNNTKKQLSSLSHDRQYTKTLTYLLYLNPLLN